MKKMILLFLIVSVSAYMYAKPARDVFLGERTVNFRSDHDEIIVGKYEGRFSKLRFEVAGNEIEIFSMKIVFANGKRHNVPVKMIFHRGGWSRLIDLPGNERFIRKIVFNYRTAGKFRRGKAVIKVFGIR